jgi:glycosyltransferase involved in cell wall biosynthesis
MVIRFPHFRTPLIAILAAVNDKMEQGETPSKSLARLSVWPGRSVAKQRELPMDASKMNGVPTRSTCAPAWDLPVDGSIELSILMPCLNEAETIATCIQKAQRWLRENGICGEIIIADNGSDDGSQEIVRGLGARVVSVSAKGYGNALMGGIQAARGEYVLMGDADDSYDFTNLFPFLNKLREGNDLVLGNRFRGGIKPGAMPPLHQYFGNPLLTAIGRLFFRSAAGDFYCGLRGFNRQAILDLDLRTTGMEFALEMVVKAALYRLRVAEVPTTLSPDGRSRRPHLRSWRDGWRSLRFLLLYSPRWLFLYPGMILMLTGAILSTRLLLGPQVIEGITFDVHTLVYGALAIMLGYQSIIFGFFTKLFAITEGLLPEDPRLTKMFKYVTLESGLIVGVAMCLGGVAASFYALSIWKARAFGPLDPFHTLRIVIPAATLIVLGFQTILSSFFLSVLGLRRR